MQSSKPSPLDLDHATVLKVGIGTLQWWPPWNVAVLGIWFNAQSDTYTVLLYSDQSIGNPSNYMAHIVAPGSKSKAELCYGYGSSRNNS